MTNTMEDLKREVVYRLRETLHGEEIDTLENDMPTLEQMLGIAPIGEQKKPGDIEGTILSANHDFWNLYYKDVLTIMDAKEEVESAIHLLKDDGIFNVSTPYGEEAGIWYCEVDTIDNRDYDGYTTECVDCGASINADSELVQMRGAYKLRFEIDCPRCDYSTFVATGLTRQ